MRSAGEGYSWKREEQVQEWEGEHPKDSRGQCGENS